MPFNVYRYNESQWMSAFRVSFFMKMMCYSKNDLKKLHSTVSHPFRLIYHRGDLAWLGEMGVGAWIHCRHTGLETNPLKIWPSSLSYRHVSSECREVALTHLWPGGYFHIKYDFGRFWLIHWALKKGSWSFLLSKVYPIQFCYWYAIGCKISLQIKCLLLCS